VLASPAPANSRRSFTGSRTLGTGKDTKSTSRLSDAKVTLRPRRGLGLYTTHTSEGCRMDLVISSSFALQVRERPSQNTRTSAGPV